MKRVVIGLSGGVDSSVAAHLLVEQGYEVIALFMKNWHDESALTDQECPWWEDSNDAREVADKLGIPFHIIDLSKEYKERVVNYMFNEYQEGRTPNPDVLCNREIKFDIFLKAAMKLKADFVATGHYCQKDEITVDGKTVYRLLAGADNNKDQSYFLCQLNQEQLGRALFPIGHLQKPEVRKIATELDLVTADKKDSQGICFIGKVKLPDFLKQQLEPKEGKVVEVSENHQVFKAYAQAETLEALAQPFTFDPSDGEVVGKHNGAHYYTVGQRKGLGIGGKEKPLFVIQKDVKTNTVYTGQGEQHPGLLRKALFISNHELHWIREDLALKPGEEAEYLVRIRYRQPLQKAKLIATEQGAYILFEQEQTGIAAGQFAAWYNDQELVGSGVIA